MEPIAGCGVCACREHFAPLWCLHQYSGSDWELRSAWVPSDRSSSLGHSASSSAPRASLTLKRARGSASPLAPERPSDSRPARLNVFFGRHAMFEDSTFESTGRIHTRSRRWMIAVFLCNTSILLAMILIPLIYPEALPRPFCPILIAPPPPQPKPQPTEQTARPTREMNYNVLVAPPKIPTGIFVPAGPEPPVDITIGSWEPPSTTPGGIPFGKPGVTVVRQEIRAPLRVSTTVEEGLLIRKTVPVYPAIAKAAGIEARFGWRPPSPGTAPSRTCASPAARRCCNRRRSMP